MTTIDIELNLSEEDCAVRDMAHKFAEEVVRPAGIELDRLVDPGDVIAPDSVLWKVFEKYHELGLGALMHDTEMDPVAKARLMAVVNEELAWGDVGLAISVSLYAGKIPYNPVTDFAPITLVAKAPSALASHPAVPAKTIKELIAFAKARPGQINFASTGNGSSPHLTTEVFKMQAGLDLVHVPYKGTPLAVTDLLTGQVSMMFANSLSVLPHVKSGRLRAIAVTSAKRSAAMPQLPTVAEQGLPGFESGTWFALLAPAGTPGEIVARLNAEVSRVTASAEVRSRLAAQGAEPQSGTPDQVAAHIRKEIDKWAKAIKASGARID